MQTSRAGDMPSRGFHPGRSAVRATAIAIITLAATACSAVNQVKVTPENEHTATGPRFYMNRPFIAVSRPFPLDSRSFLIDAIVSPDGRYVRITGNVASLQRGEAIEHATDVLTEQLLDLDDLSTNVIFRTPSPGTDDHGAPRAQGDVDLPDLPDPLPAPDKEPTRTTGQSNLKMKTELAGLPHFPVNEYFNIVFLPDYEEMYVLEQTEAGLGNADRDLTVGPGNIALEMAVKVDNQAVTGPITEAYAALTKMGVAAARAALAATSGLPIAQGQTLVAPITTAESMAASEDVVGQPVTLRVHVVKFAALGVYPIVKPQEVSRYLGAKHELESRHYLVPVQGYQVPYKYFEVIVFEHVFTGDKTTSLVDFRSAVDGGGDANGNPNANGDTGDATQRAATAGRLPANLPAAGLAGAIERKLAGFSVDGRKVQVDRAAQSGAGGGFITALDVTVTMVDAAGSPVPSKPGDQSAIEAELKRLFSLSQATVDVSN